MLVLSLWWDVRRADKSFRSNKNKYGENMLYSPIIDEFEKSGINIPYLCSPNFVDNFSLGSTLLSSKVLS